MTYIMVDDKNLKGIHGKTFEVLEETAEKFVINQNGTKSWIPKENARLLPDRFVPYEGHLERVTPETYPAIIPAGIHPIYLEEWPDVENEDPDDVDNVVEKGGNNEEKDVLTYGILFHPNDEMANLEELKKASELIRALRKRSTKKAIANMRMSRQIDMMGKELREVKKDLDGFIEDNNRLKETNAGWARDYELVKEDTLKEYNFNVKLKEELEKVTKLNDHHREQVEIGNERAEKLKQTIESLHEQLNAKNQTIAGQATMIRAMEETDERNKRIIDALTRKTGF
jgi:hypothetical protein